MAKNIKGNSQVATANRLRDGAVVFRTAAGGWSTRLAEAEVADDEAAAVRLLAAVEHDATAAIVVAPYLIAVRDDDGVLRALSLREKIRANGPSVPPLDLAAIPYL